MNRPRTVAAAAVLAALALPIAVAAARDRKTDEPFYRRYLIPGSPLDDRIVEQEKRVAARPDDADLRNDFGNLLAERRFPKEAREQYETAMKLDKKNFIAPYNMGLVLETEDRIGAAISSYEKSVARNRGFPPARFRLGRLYEKRGRTDAAIEQYARAFEIDPTMRDVRRNPLIVDTRLLGRVSLTNYSKDIARASLHTQAVYTDERFRRAPVDRPLWSDETVDPLSPEPVDRSHATPESAPMPASIPPGPGQVRPQSFGVRPDAPPPVNAPVPTPMNLSPPPDENSLGTRPRPPLPTPLPQ